MMADSRTMSLNQNENKSAKEPSALIHKQILDTAQSHPTATISEISDLVSGASVDLTERVLHEYGDPGNDPDVTMDNSDTDTSQSLKGDAEPSRWAKEGSTPEDEDGRVPYGNSSYLASDSVDWSELSKKQKETLRAIHENPEATQTELGEMFNVNKSTICQRVNSIEGFNWQLRQPFVNSIFKERDVKGDHRGTDEYRKLISENKLVEQVEELSRRIDTIQQEICCDTDSPDSILTDPDMNHKIIQACIECQNVSDYEVERLIKEVIQACLRGATGTSSD